MSGVINTFSINRGGIRFPTQDEGIRMKTNEQLLTEANRLREEAERLETIAEQRNDYGADPFKNGTVLKIDMKYRTGRQSYTYGAIKIAGRFYLTGKVQAKPTFLGEDHSDVARGWTWENFVAWLAQGDATVWKAGKLEQVL